jgi:hypothetical protein
MGARAVPPWLHRVLVRQFGPKDPFVRLTVFGVNSFMDRSGIAYPSQEAIAAATWLGVSTVRRKIADANLAAWLSIEARAAYMGQHWKQYLYRACVPDTIDLKAFVVDDTTGQTADDLAEQWEAIHGSIDPSNLRGTLFPQTGKRRAPPRAGGIAPPAPGGSAAPPTLRREEAPPADARSTARPEQKHRPLTPEAPPADDQSTARGGVRSLKGKSSGSFNPKSQEEGRSLRESTGALEGNAVLDEPVPLIARVRLLLASRPGLNDEQLAIRLKVATADVAMVRRFDERRTP